MQRMDIERLAENYALNQYLSDYESNYDEIIEGLYKDDIPEDVIVWKPFEYCSLNDLAAYIENTRNDFLSFYKQVKGA